MLFIKTIIMTTEQKQHAENLATQIGELSAAIVHAIPNASEEDKQEYLNLIKTGIDKAASTPPSDNAVKDITENAVDVLEAIADIVPDSDDVKKQRAKKRFKSATVIIRGMLHMFGL